ncbi:MAG: 30S ribosomal protein S13 [Patescibacteria group bacterium]|nr:30S ribosomal protein S13 [Patescibacteria group bacterium]
MARISGVTIPKEKRVEISLTYIYGIGRVLANRILQQAKVNPDKRVKDLTDDEVNRLREIIDKSYKVEGELKRDVLMNIKRLKEIDSYRGSRHAKKLPARGQKTKNNGRTVRGNVRRTMGSGRKPAGQKT